MRKTTLELLESLTVNIINSHNLSLIRNLLPFRRPKRTTITLDFLKLTKSQCYRDKHPLSWVELFRLATNQLS